ncbi:hypothetical protein QWJ26_26470 [Streptomyces sp. CSDS2]|uniref:hypothetical protein n=1 Tax=Streptomyces sp. CSDS2 TaxID=3055051 RepID=UPI0025B14EE4|nr:hypothetical protein [Streptomyces sp. CSDS2]MDN3263290.1 hypothetical protein [Streptomyces sp. CSDS2]
MTDKPTAYGYMRVPKNASDDEVRALEEQIMIYAERCGLDLRGIHEEHDNGVILLEPMAKILEEDGVGHVIVPSLENLSTHMAVQIAMIQVIHAAGAALHNVAAATGDPDDAPAGDHDQ